MLLKSKPTLTGAGLTPPTPTLFSAFRETQSPFSGKRLACSAKREIDGKHNPRVRADAGACAERARCLTKLLDTKNSVATRAWQGTGVDNGEPAICLVCIMGASRPTCDTARNQTYLDS